jgi:hypothetical protein
MAAVAVKGLAANSKGTGLAAALQSKLWACRNQVFISAAGKLSHLKYCSKLFKS